MLVILLVSLYASSLWPGTTGKIVGKVTDAATGESLPGANVVITGSSMGAATDFEGDYYIINVPPGNYSVQVTMIGFTTLTKTGVVVNSDHTTRVEFPLQETILEVGETVTVMADRPLIEKDNTSTRHFVQAEEIAARPTTQLTQILTTLPGIDLNAAGELVVRRGSLDQVAFLIDGIRARNPLDFEPYTNINLTAIQELELITGGFNAEYGEAQSGIFNIVTKEGGNRVTAYSEFRWTPPGKRHWGTEFYDYSTNRYWENSHARHMQWWIENPDQWVDPSGTPGNDPNSIWTPEEAYQDYIDTHQPLTDYTDRSSYQLEMSLGGPLAPIKNLFFFFSGKYRTAPPITGNSIRDNGTWFDGSAKLTYKLNPNMKLLTSGFFNESNSNQGMEFMDEDWVTGHGLRNKYAYYDFPGFPENRTDGLTMKLTHVLNQNSFYELQLSRVHRFRAQGVFPGDSTGWEAGVPEFDRLRARDENGNPISGGFSNLIGLHTTGYYYRGEDNNTDLTFSGDFVSQITKRWQIKSGGDFTYYILDRFQEGKAFNVLEDEVYHPYEGNLYFQNKLEFEGLIMNLGLRYDFYNSNNDIYTEIFDPFDLFDSVVEGRDPNPETKPSPLFGQLSPRIGISHPISESTVLHFSYGHFFQRASFGDYGEGTEVTGILNTYRTNPEFGQPQPFNLGNRELKPRKTVAYELGIERNFSGLVAEVTAFYKDITNTIRTVTVITRSGGRYLTSGNGNYGDAKGVEISLRKPLTGFWGGYLNYSWSTGIEGRSGDPDVIAPPGSNVQVGQIFDVGDFILYDPVRLKFGVIAATPVDYSPLGGLLSNIQLSLDYQIYYPHRRIANDVFSESGQQFLRPPDRNADIRLRKEFRLMNLRPALFVEVRNAFNDKWVNLNLVKSGSPEDRVRFINSNFEVFPATNLDGSPFPDVIQYRNLPRTWAFGVALGF
jgi:outer membrane receptor protein involved in Fe transport